MTCPRCYKNLKILLEYAKKINLQEYDYLYSKYFKQVQRGNWLINTTREIYCNNKGSFVIDRSENLNNILEVSNLTLGEFIYKREFEIESESYNYQLLPCLYHLNKEKRDLFYLNQSNSKNRHIQKMFLELRKQHSIRAACGIISERIEPKKSWQTVKRLVYSR